MGPEGAPGLGPAAAVDTEELDEGAGRLDRAADGLRDAGAGLERLPVVAVATGADALLDALADLGRQWRSRLDVAVAQADTLAAGLRSAAADYTRAERDASDASDGLRLVDLLPGLVTPTSPPAPAGPAPGGPDAR